MESERLSPAPVPVSNTNPDTNTNTNTNTNTKWVVRQTKMTPEIRDVIYKGFEEHSIQEIGVSNVDEPICFNILNDDHDGMNNENRYASVVVAQNFWGAFYVKYVWTAQIHRGKGYARTLMNEALMYAKENGYTFATVVTMSFQAPEFYKKFGFVEEFKRDGYSNGISIHYLKKDL